MSINQFFNIYHPRQKPDGTVELAVGHPPIFIWLKSGYSNNKFWEQDVFRVPGEWEYSESTILFEDQRIPRDWRILASDHCEIPFIDEAARAEVDKMIA